MEGPSSISFPDLNWLEAEKVPCPIRKILEHFGKATFQSYCCYRLLVPLWYFERFAWKFSEIRQSHSLFQKSRGLIKKEESFAPVSLPISFFPLSPIWVTCFWPHFPFLGLISSQRLTVDFLSAVSPNIDCSLLCLIRVRIENLWKKPSVSWFSPRHRFLREYQFRGMPLWKQRGQHQRQGRYKTSDKGPKEERERRKRRP